jgi:plastocyanin
VHAASLQGSKWNDQVVATEPPCGSCPEPGPTQIAFVGGKPVVVFGDPAKHEVDTATQQGSGWRVESLAAKTDGLGLSAAAIENTLYASYYTTDRTVNLTTVKGGAPTTTTAGQAEKPDPNDTGNDAPRTAVTADPNGAVYVAWDNGDSGVAFVTAAKDSQTFDPIALGPSRASSAHPALAASDLGVFLTWYDTVNEDLMMGQYADVQNLIVANPQPSIVPSVSVAGPACPQAKKVQLDIAAQNTAFDPTCLIAPAEQTFTIEFDNRDSAAATGDHNIGIYDEAGGKELFRGDPVAGPDQVPYDVDALKTGTYFFQCDFHPSLMTGTLQVVQGAS